MVLGHLFQMDGRPVRHNFIEGRSPIRQGTLGSDLK